MAVSERSKACRRNTGWQSHASKLKRKNNRTKQPSLRSSAGSLTDLGPDCILLAHMSQVHTTQNFNDTTTNCALSKVTRFTKLLRQIKGLWHWVSNILLTSTLTTAACFHKSCRHLVGQCRRIHLSGRGAKTTISDPRQRDVGPMCTTA